MAFTDNPALSPEALLTLSGNILAAPTFAQGVGTGLQNLGTYVGAQKEKAIAKQQENQTRAWLQQQYPDMDFSSFSGPTLNAAASQALGKRLNPAQPDFKVLPDGTYGTWDGKQFNKLGTAQKQEDLPQAYQDFLLQQKNPDYRAYKDEERVAKESPTAKDRMDAEMDTRKTYRAEPYVKNYQTVKTAYQKGRQAAQMDSAAGDMSLVYSFMKMQDPESVVREGEYATAEKAGSVQDWVVNIYNRVRTGQRLTAQQKADFVKAMDEQYQIASKGLSDTNSQYEPFAEEYGLPKERLFTQPEKFAPLDLKSLGDGQTVTTKDKNGNPVTIQKIPE